MSTTKTLNAATATENQTVQIANVSRRKFLGGMGMATGLVLAARWDMAFAEDAQYGRDAMPNGWTDNPNVFVSIATDGSVTIVNHRAEMGQGIRTSLVMVVADEMGADWNKVAVEQANANEPKYGNQNTDGSRSMRHFFEPMRRVGAAARHMLEQAAAQVWNVPVSDVTTTIHQVVHRPTNRTLSFAELAELAAEMKVPVAASLKLKQPSEWRYISKNPGAYPEGTTEKTGQPMAIDGRDIVTGKAVFGADVSLDGMLVAKIVRPPVYCAGVKSFDATEAQKVAGVVDVIELPTVQMPSAFTPLGGIAVVAENTWAAIKGARALKIEWDNAKAGDNASYDSVAYRQQLEAAVQQPGKVVRSEGDFEQVLHSDSANNTVEASYYMPHLSQSPMEPMVAIAQVKNGKAEIWASVQNPQLAKDGVAGQLGLKPEDVTVHCTLLGGGFGRKSKPDYIFEAAALSAKLNGRPVRVQWTREDDIQQGYYHTVSLDRLEGVLDSNGKSIGWRHRSASPSITSLFGPDSGHTAVFENGMGFNTVPFDIPAIQLENPAAPAHVRIGWYRAVYNLPHAFAIQSFAAELAHEAGVDHKQYLLDLIGPARKINPTSIGEHWNYGENPAEYVLDTGRLRDVIEMATSKAGWGKTMPKNRGLGLAVHNSFVSYVAVVFDAEVTDAGELIIHRADIAVDCGPQVNPDRIRSQMEGACVMGISNALVSEITAKDGAIQQSNFHNYQVARIVHAPKEIHVHAVNNRMDVPMGGIGEPGVPPVAPALCNAIFAASGKRIRTLPIANQLKTS